MAKQSRSIRWINGAVGALVVTLVLGLALGFLGFAHAVRTNAAPDPMPRADAIVALTGGSQARLETGVRLLEEGRARRLLISGVNREVTDDELMSLLDVSPQARACCVALGRAAEDTLGNAAETAEWAARYNVRTLIVVTDDYHMPRSVAELSLALPDVELIAYPVPTRFARDELWKRDMSAAARMGAEYLKYLTIRVREGFAGLGRGDDRAMADTPEKSTPKSAE
ncbi:MAG: YdcF family protein [Alphaproteobacteria bacterium]|nr:YdcF family protein [Alphaproteobacteria bacterium]